MRILHGFSKKGKKIIKFKWYTHHSVPLYKLEKNTFVKLPLELEVQISDFRKNLAFVLFKNIYVYFGNPSI